MWASSTPSSDPCPLRVDLDDRNHAARQHLPAHVLRSELEDLAAVFQAIGEGLTALALGRRDRSVGVASASEVPGAASFCGEVVEGAVLAPATTAEPFIPASLWPAMEQSKGKVPSLVAITVVSAVRSSARSRRSSGSIGLHS